MRPAREWPWRVIGAVASAAGLSVIAVWTLWGGLLRAGGIAGLGSSVKDYFLGDQLAYMAVASNVASGLPAYFVEPFTASGQSIAPSAYFWAIGWVAKVAGLSIFGAWNVLGMVVTLLLIASLLWWARWASPGSLAWAIAPAALLIGSLQWMAVDGWSIPYASHAVLWAPIAILNSPGAEPACLALVIVAIISVGQAYLRTGTARITWSAVAGLALGIVILAHTYVAMFAIVMVLLAVVAFRARQASRSWGLIAVGILAAGILIAALLPTSSALARLAVILIAAAVAACVMPGDRRAQLAPPALALGVSAVVSAPLLVVIARQARDPSSFFYLRQQWASDSPLSLPLAPVLAAFAPVFLLGLAACVGLWRQKGDQRATWWFACVAAALAATFLLTFNAAWGMKQEPYRFLPYGTFLIAGLALPWLWDSLARRTRLAWAAAAIAGLLLLTIPTTAAFGRDPKAILRIPNAETDAYADITRATGGQLTLFDRCFRPELVKALAGGRVLAVNRGHAIPDRYPEVQAVLDQVAARATPPEEQLRGIGVRWVVTSSACEGMSRASLERLFGPPIIIPLRSRAGDGLPTGLDYLIFAVPDGMPDQPGGASRVNRPSSGNRTP